MHLDPQKSREARAEIGSRSPVALSAAASSSSHPQDSPEHAISRGPQPATGEGAVAGQPFNRERLELASVYWALLISCFLFWYFVWQFAREFVR